VIMVIIRRYGRRRAGMGPPPFSVSEKKK
jgi:hypothetical protein